MLGESTYVYGVIPAGLLLLAGLGILWHRWTACAWPPGTTWIALAVVACTLLLVYPVRVSGGVVRFHGFPFLVMALDARGRAFAGVISLLALLGNFLIAAWTSVLLRRLWRGPEGGRRRRSSDLE